MLVTGRCCGNELNRVLTKAEGEVCVEPDGAVVVVLEVAFGA